MKKPIIVVMAAGLSTRYGLGLKQICPVDGAGHNLIDFSLYDAARAGFDRVVFIIKPEMEENFHANIGRHIENRMEVTYAHQTLEMLPVGFKVPEGRVRPWGTAHAVLCAKPYVDTNFAVINADDLYGAAAFRSVYDFLTAKAGDGRHAMIGYALGNTLTENGHVARGVCKTGADGSLLEITERTHIEARPGGAAYTADGVNYTYLPGDTVVSMNIWAFGLSMMDEIHDRFPAFLSRYLPADPLKCEYFLPLVPNLVLREGRAAIQVLPTSDKWYGVTYAADMPVVRQAVSRMKSEGKYPELLWGETR